MEPLVWVPSAPGQNPAATAAAEPLDEPPGVCSGTPGIAGLSGREKRELSGHGLAEHERARPFEVVDDASGSLGHVAAEDGRAAFGGDAARGHDVLHADWQPVKRTERRDRPLRGVRRFRALHRPRAVEPSERCDLVLDLRDAREAAAGEVGARHLPGGDLAGGLDEAQLEQGLHGRCGVA